MPLGVLNNISAVYAENNLNQTQASLQNVLTQLSSGSRINSGADDPAGLSIANGLAANAAALTQSSSNASEGAGFLQVADGALSQVTSLLTSAVSLATEAGGGTLSGSQLNAADQEYQDILTQIGTIGQTTEYNGIKVFTASQAGTASNVDFEGNAVVANHYASVSSQVVTQGDAGSITAGDTLAGNVVISSTGGKAEGSQTINLADYQGLASSSAAQVTATLAQLSKAVTAGLGATTGSTYMAALSAQGVLSITTSSETAAPANVTFSTAAATSTITSSVLPTNGAALSGTLDVLSTIPGVNGGAAQTLGINLGAAAYVGLDGPAGSAAQTAALANLNTALNATSANGGFAHATGSTYAATITAGGALQITTTQPPVAQGQPTNVAFTSPSLGVFKSTQALGAGNLLTGDLNITSAHGTAGATASIDLSAAKYDGLTGSGSALTTAETALGTALGTALAASGNTYTVTEDGTGHLVITSSETVDTETLADNSSTVQQATAASGETLATTGSNVTTAVGEALAAGAGSDVTETTATTGIVNIYTSDGTTDGSQNYSVTVGALTDGSVGTSTTSSPAQTTNVAVSENGQTGVGGILAGAGAGTSLTGTNLTSQAAAEAALQTVGDAINAVAYQRGQVGANINELTAASNIASSQMTNITAAQNTISATDYAAATSNMSKYEILTQTGISALAQANSTQQMVTKLLQQ
jgi:flagellin